MNPSRLSMFVLSGMMVLASLAAAYAKPTVRLAETMPMPALEKIVPSQFGIWHEETSSVGAVIDPQIQSELKRIYTQILSRTYINDRGERIMLSIAYGKDQSDTTQVHYPEICYPAQGFQIGSTREEVLSTRQGDIPLKRLETSMENQRYEPVTYWTTVGDVVVTNRTDKKLVEMRYGFKGQIPDGLLFRVSSIDRDAAAAFRLQDDFVKAMQAALDPASKLRLMGIHG
ncbi:EpsI family protein [Janthinobacterium sp. CAN_S7]